MKETEILFKSMPALFYLLSLQIIFPLMAVASRENKCFMLTREIKIKHLPLAGTNIPLFLSEFGK